MIHRETLKLITMLAPNPPTLRQIMSAGHVFHVSLTAQLLVRTRFRRLMFPCYDTWWQVLPNSRRDGREYLVFLGRVYGFRYYINGQRHGVSKRWYVDGELRFTAHYHYGKLHGTFTESYGYGYGYGDMYRIRNWDHGVIRGAQGCCHPEDGMCPCTCNMPEILREVHLRYELEWAPDIITMV